VPIRSNVVFLVWLWFNICFWLVAFVGNLQSKVLQGWFSIGTWYLFSFIIVLDVCYLDGHTKCSPSVKFLISLCHIGPVVFVWWSLLDKIIAFNVWNCWLMLLSMETFASEFAGKRGYDDGSGCLCLLFCIPSLFYLELNRMLYLTLRFYCILRTYVMNWAYWSFNK
jgi:hypothetical protein